MTADVHSPPKVIILSNIDLNVQNTVPEPVVVTLHARGFMNMKKEINENKSPTKERSATVGTISSVGISPTQRQELSPPAYLQEFSPIISENVRLPHVSKAAPIMFTSTNELFSPRFEDIEDVGALSEQQKTIHNVCVPLIESQTPNTGPGLINVQASKVLKIKEEFIPPETTFDSSDVMFISHDVTIIEITDTDDSEEAYLNQSQDHQNKNLQSADSFFNA